MERLKRFHASYDKILERYKRITENACKIVPLLHSDVDSAMKLCEIAFQSVGGNSDGSPSWVTGFIKDNLDFNLSVKAVCNGELAGVYVLQENNITSNNFNFIEDISRYKDLRGVEGVALAVKSKFKGTGVGKSLINYSLNLPYDYIWGQQLKDLKNIQFWASRRRVVAENSDMFVTLADL